MIDVRVSSHLRVLLDEFSEIVEKTVLRAQKVKLVVPLFFLHELSEKLAAISSNKLGSQLDDVQVKCRYGRRICDKLKLGRWFFGDNRLLNHLRLHLLKTEYNIVFATQNKWGGGGQKEKSDVKAVSYFLGKLLGLLHCLLHNLRHRCRWFLRFAFFKFIDLMTVVGMVGIIRVKEIKLWIVDLILTDPCFKLWSIPRK